MRGVTGESRGVFAVTDPDMHKVPPYQNDELILHVKAIGTFDHVRAASPAPACAAIVVACGCSVSWSEGEHPRLNKLHN